FYQATHDEPLPPQVEIGNRNGPANGRSPSRGVYEIIDLDPGPEVRAVLQELFVDRIDLVSVMGGEVFELDHQPVRIRTIDHRAVGRRGNTEGAVKDAGYRGERCEPSLEGGPVLGRCSFFQPEKNAVGEHEAASSTL